MKKKIVYKIKSGRILSQTHAQTEAAPFYVHLHGRQVDCNCFQPMGCDLTLIEKGESDTMSLN
jgi:hypothetical protein